MARLYHIRPTRSSSWLTLIVLPILLYLFATKLLPHWNEGDTAVRLFLAVWVGMAIFGLVYHLRNLAGKKVSSGVMIESDGSEPTAEGTDVQCPSQIGFGS
jgi:hypothetical protein